jgi:hypothetical protein
MKYLVFYHEIPERVSQFITEDPSFVPLNGVLINAVGSSKEQDQLSDLLYENGDGRLKFGVVSSLESEPLVIDGPITIIHVGIIL